MAAETIEKELQDTEEIQKEHLSFEAQVEVLNDDSYPAEKVIQSFCEVLPGYTRRKAFTTMLRIHRHGVGTVWQGPREVCELYCEQLKARGLKAQVA